MKKALLSLMGFLCLSLSLAGQSGTPGDPFTSLIQAGKVSTGGTYYFSLTGVDFSTYVDDNGYVLVAIDFGDGSGDLPQGSALTESSRGILSEAVLATLTETSEIRLSDSEGFLDATNRSSILVNRVITGTSLMNNVDDNALQDGWTGTGSNVLREDAVGRSGSGNHLYEEVFHTEGNGNGMHWIPSRGDQALTFGDEILPEESLRLWVRNDGPTGSLGSSTNPFTTLSDALTTTTPGVYHFRLGGYPFSTYVEAGGYVQVAIDFATIVGDLPQVTALSAAERGILSPAVLAELGEAAQLRLSDSQGNLDAVTSNATLLTRVTSNATLKNQVADNVFNEDWTGTGAQYLTAPATENSASVSTLNIEIFHPQGNSAGMHWIPQRGDHALTYSNELPAGQFLRMSVRAAQALPLDLLSFTAQVTGRGVDLEWRIASAGGGESVAVERSYDGTTWASIHDEFLDLDLQDHEFGYLDTDLRAGPRYYRLRQTDFDGAVDYSSLIPLTIGGDRAQDDVYPNPVRTYLTVETHTPSDRVIEVYNNLGARVTSRIRVTTREAHRAILDLSALPTGIYYVSVPGGSLRRVVKQ